ncbi:iron ABC transporter permease [Selenomonas sp. oral taxon 149]|uniref:FecCD family ABC transporter permease n=1 Tax=Selenomonas sp. oral taxon 149 TaxID=712535 RepID=UPI0001E0D393|nr:iron ABC transporter permease [Selenomonas sp. oral taxon 149]EFM21989.1 iron chelate uptake ABC transporter, FeCT family, permease protein [Selenomonas sp. oral taxon 149 str. 67H29BP]
MSRISPQYKLTVLLLLLVALICVSSLLGRYAVRASDVLAACLGWMGLAPTVHGGAQVVMELRLPRIVGAVLVGAALSVSGAAYQVMFRNPMVSPTILRVSAGAAFGAAIAILLSLPVLVVHLTTFGGGLLAVAITYVVGVKFCRGGNTTLAIILSGIIVSTLFTSLLSMIKYVADPYDKLPVIVYWLMGSLAPITRDNLILPLLLMAAAFLLLYFLRWKINLLSFGDEEAKSLGIPVERLRLTVIICATLMTAAAVSISGIIGLVGLVVPHLVRFIVGPDFRFLLPGSALMDGLFLLASDNLARTLWTMEIPLGILTSLFGVPFFLYLLIKYHHSWD